MIGVLNDGDVNLELSKEAEAELNETTSIDSGPNQTNSC